MSFLSSTYAELLSIGLVIFSCVRGGVFFKNSEGLPSHLCGKLTDELEMMKVILYLTLL